MYDETMNTINSDGTAFDGRYKPVALAYGILAVAFAAEIVYVVGSIIGFIF